MDKIYRWIVLKSIRGLGEKSLKKLFNSLGSSEEILKADRNTLSKIVGEKKADLILRRECVSESKVDTILKSLEREGINVITLEDEDYPQKLRGIEDPPPVLFYRGELRDLPLVGIVGTRKAAAYSFSLVDELVRKAVERGYGTVSGGARGIDMRAHFRTLELLGYTVCVLGFGILRAKGSFFRKLEESGLLLSEFFPNEPADRFTFPRRNRIIASLSEFLIVPEAGSKSGALITADYASSYGKRIFVHIGMGRSPNWEGCYKLLKEGKAELFKDPEEIFGGEEDGSPILDFLNVPRTFEEIREFSGIDDGELFSLLSNFEMEGKIRRIGSFYVKI